jgi:hypothetical protein
MGPAHHIVFLTENDFRTIDMFPLSGYNVYRQVRQSVTPLRLYSGL